MAVSEQIIQVLDALCEKFGIVIDWANTNVLPEISTLCTKLVTWEIWSSVAWIGIMVVLCLISFILIKKFYPVFKKGLEEDKENYDCGWTFGSGLAIIGLIVLYIATFAVIGTQIMDIVKCSTFPEMHVFEYIQGLVNAAK